MNTESAIEKVAEAKQNYYQKCYHFALNFVKKQSEEFTSETIKNAYAKTKNPEPHEPRVWGAVIRELSRTNIISFVGYQKYISKKGHGRPSSIWKTNNN